MNSETFHYKRGANQVFSQPTHVVDPTQFSLDDVSKNLLTDRTVVCLPIVCSLHL
jgi:hypothetical protein